MREIRLISAFVYASAFGLTIWSLTGCASAPRVEATQNLLTQTNGCTIERVPSEHPELTGGCALDAFQNATSTATRRPASATDEKQPAETAAAEQGGDNS